MSFVFVGHRNTVQPFNAMRIEHELAIALRVIKYDHPFAANDRQLLFLEWMQPADKKMGLNSTIKFAGGQRSVCNLRIKVTASVRSNARWHFVQQIQNCGDVMGRKAPEDILLCTKLAQIQA